MPALHAYLAQRHHRHEWTPVPCTSAERVGVRLERCECGAVRAAESPAEAETD